MRKAEALFAYLAMYAGRPHLRDDLASLLWGRRSDDSARNSLRQALFSIRQGFSVPNLVIQRGTVSLNPDAVDVDVHAFERDAAEGTPAALERAITLYRGDLLAGLHVYEAPFEAWLLTERQRLREIAEACLAKLLDHYGQAGETESAIQAALRLLGINPLQESIYRTLMSLYARSGRRGSALRQYQLCVAVLQRELGIEPESETKALYQEILRSPVRRQPPASTNLSPALMPDTVLVDREGELTALRTALTDTSAKRGRVMAVLGEAGIGKTRLMAELAGEASRRGLMVLAGRAYETERSLPFGPWADALRSARLTEDRTLLDTLGPAYRTHLARVVPEVQPERESAGSEADDRPVFESILELIRLQATKQPVLVVLEDIHWADPMTIRLTAFLGHRLHAWPVMLVLTAREDDLADAPHLVDALEELGRESHFGRLVLPPLTRANTTRLVRTLSRTGDTAGLRNIAEHVWALSEGNPFVVMEAMRAKDWTRATTTLTLPQRVRDMVQRRLERLTDTSRHLVATAAVIGRDFDFALLQRASGFSVEEAAESVEELVRRRVIQGVDERLGFVHDRIQRTAESQLLPHRRVILHRAVAEAIEHLYEDALEPHDVALATHYREAGVWDRAMMYASRAAFHAVSDGANHEAAILFSHALDALEHLPETDESMQAHADLMMALTWIWYSLADLDNMTRALRSLQSLATKLGDHTRLKRCFEGLAIVSAIRGNLPAATDAIERAVAHSDSTTKVVEWESLTHIARGDYRRAAAAARAALDALRGEHAQARFWGVLPSLPPRCFLVWSLTELGEFPEAIREAEEMIEIADATRHTSDAVFAYFAAGRLYVIKGDLTRATPVLERMLPLCDRGGNFFLCFSWAAQLLGLTYVLSGRASDGLNLLRAAVAADNELGLALYHSKNVASLGEGYLLSGDVEAAARYASEALTMARNHGFHALEAEALHLHGEIARMRNDLQEATGFYQKARALATKLRMRPLLAHCHRGLARVVTEPGARAAHLRTATTMYRAMDMRFWLERGLTPA